MFSYSTVADRQYKRLACPSDERVQYLHHPSGVTVIVLRTVPDSKIVEVDFSSTKKNGIDRGGNAVVGKGKKGGLMLQAETRLCTLKCEDGSEIVVRSGIRGVLAEVNERLKTCPDLARTAPENQGFIAIVTQGAGQRELEMVDGMDELPAKRVHLQTAA